MLENLENVPIDELIIAEDIIGHIFSMIIVGVIAICFAALVLLWIYNECKEVLSMRGIIVGLKKDKANSDQAISDYEDVYIITKNSLDEMHTMYEKEKSGRARDKKNAEQWDLKQKARIQSLEQQLLDNGIVPLTTEEVLMAA